MLNSAEAYIMTFPVEWYVFKDNNGLWHWRHYTNDKTYEDSGESFSLKADCIKDAKKHGYNLKIDDFDLYQGNHD